MNDHILLEILPFQKSLAVSHIFRVYYNDCVGPTSIIRILMLGAYVKIREKIGSGQNLNSTSSGRMETD